MSVGPPGGRAAPRADRGGRLSRESEARLRALGKRVEPRRTGGHGVRRNRRRLRWVLGSMAMALTLVIGAIAGYAWYLNSEIHRVNVPNLTSGATSGAGKGTENILMVGSTSRCALKVQNPAYGLCSEGVTGVNSDVVMILHLDKATHVVSILSIPRDLFVPNARAEGANKIDAALYEGPSQLVAAIQENLGIPIQHFIELNFDTFANVVDALGGIRMYFPEPVFDSYSGLNIPAPGCIALNGVRALQVVRARHLQYRPATVLTSDSAAWPYDPQSDLSRIRRDHEFLRVLATAVAKKGIGDPITDSQIVSAVAAQLEVDAGLSASQMVHLVLTFHGVNPNGAPQLTLPIVVDHNGSYHYKNGDYGDIVWPNQPEDQQVIDQFLGVGPNIDTMTGRALPSPAGIRVSVLNGTGALHQAATTVASLGALGFKATSAGDTPAVASQSETVVYYSSNTPAEQAAAQTVAHALSGYVITALDPSRVTAGSDVTVVTGSNFSVNPPPPPPSATTSSTAAANPTTTAPTASTALAASAPNAPTASVEPLQPWDPRSCTPTGGEGT